MRLCGYIWFVCIIYDLGSLRSRSMLRKYIVYALTRSPSLLLSMNQIQVYIPMYVCMYVGRYVGRQAGRQVGKDR